MHCEATDEDAVAEACKDADAILGRSADITASVIERATKLKFIQQGIAGYDRIDIEAAARRDIPVSNAGNANSSSVAEFVMLTALMIQRKIRQASAAIRGGSFAKVRGELGIAMIELRDKTMGIVGLGRIGREVAKRARSFDMRILYYDIVRILDQPVQAQML